MDLVGRQSADGKGVADAFLEGARIVEPCRVGVAWAQSENTVESSRFVEECGGLGMLV